MANADETYERGFKDAIEQAIELIKMRRDLYDDNRRHYMRRVWMGPYNNVYLTRYGLLMSECEAIIIELAMLIMESE